MPFLLRTIPVEVLQVITSCLEAEDIACLYFTGDASLQHRMTTQGGVSRFAVSNALQFPRLASKFRLSSFRLHITVTGSSLTRIVPGVDLSILGSTIEELILDFPTALAKLDELTAPLNSLFPILKTLTLPESPPIPVDFPPPGWIKALPNTLRNLSLPTRLPISFQELSTLPCHLESLRVCLALAGNDKEEQARQFVACPAFACLISLDLYTKESVRWVYFVPPTVQHFSWGMGAIIGIPRQPLTPEDMNKLPRGLKSLAFDLMLGDDYHLLHHLPPGLTSLRLATHYAPRLQSADFLLHLPHTLRFLQTPGFGDEAPGSLPSSPSRILYDSIPCFPPNIQIWENYVVFNRLVDIPKSLTKLSIAQLDDDKVVLLPPSLQQLVVLGSVNLHVGGAQNLPRTLTTLEMHVYSVLDAALLQYLPALSKLIIKACTLTTQAFPDELWLRSWPQTLQHLQLGLTAQSGALSPSFWLSLPKCLTEVIFSLHDYSTCPKTLAFLPRTLTACFMCYNDVNATFPNDPPMFADSFFADIPSSLLSLILNNFCFKLTPAFCLNLPKKLALLNLQNYGVVRRLPTPPFVPFGITKERMPLLSKFLDILPKFATIALRVDSFHNELDFAKYLEQRQIRALEKDCPNLPVQHKNALGPDDEKEAEEDP